MKSLQLDKPHAIIVIGIQGSGKTFFAEKFSETFSAPYIEQSMFRHFSKTQKAGDEVMAKVLRETLKTNKSIVVELANASRNDRAELVKLLKSTGYVPLLVWVQIDAESAMSRTYRAHGISQQDFKKSLSKFDPPIQADGALVISGKHTFATQAKAILKRLTSPRPSRQPVERKPSSRGQIIVR